MYSDYIERLSNIVLPFHGETPIEINGLKLPGFLATESMLDWDHSHETSLLI